ncbi:MAG: hypothetical protein ACP5VE_15440 [Chthonomonadales bacterium]
MRTAFVAVAAAFLVLLSAPRLARSQGVPHVRGVDASAVVAELRAGAKASGCDLDHRGVDLVLAFSTSHFGTDPGHAAGLRELALDFVRRFSTVGDRVAVAGWEMDLWSWSGPVNLSADTPAGRVAEVSPLLPRTPQAGSVGGHDTERSICSIWKRVQSVMDPRSCVVLLFTSHQASMLPPEVRGQKLLGANDPEYAEVMDRVTRMPAIAVSFATMKQGDGAAWVPRQADVVVLIPHALEGRILLSPRGAAGAPTSAGHVHPSPNWKLAGLVGLVALVLLLGGVSVLRFARIWRSRVSDGPAPTGDLVLVYHGQTVPILKGSRGTPVAQIVAEGHLSKSLPTLEANTLMGPREGGFLADLYFNKGHLDLRPGEGVQTFINEEWVDESYTLDEGRPYVCEFNVMINMVQYKGRCEFEIRRQSAPADQGEPEKQPAP